MSAPQIPDAAGAILKALIVSLANAGLITRADTENLIALLGLSDA